MKNVTLNCINSRHCHWLSILFLFFLYALGLEAQTVVEAELDSVQILIGEQTRLTLKAKVAKGKDVSFPHFSENQFITPEVEVVELADEKTRELKDNLIEVSRCYTLTSFKDSVYLIPSQKIIVGGKVYPTKSIKLKVLPVEFDSISADKVYPMKDIQSNPFDIIEWMPVMILILIAIIVVIILFFLISRYRKNKPLLTIKKTITRLLPHQKALNDLEIVGHETDASNDQKWYYTRLTEILRIYMFERFGINAMEMTSGEIIEMLQSEKEVNSVKELKQLFDTADLVKFAKYSVQSSVNSENMNNAINFIMQTKIEIAGLETESQPQLTEQEKAGRQSRVVLKVLIGVLSFMFTVIIAYIIWRVVDLTT